MKPGPGNQRYQTIQNFLSGLLLLRVLDSWKSDPSNCCAVSFRPDLSTVVFILSPAPLSCSPRKNSADTYFSNKSLRTFYLKK